MQRNRISFENLLHIVDENQLTNFTLLLEDFNKEYVIESRTTDDTEIQNTIHTLTRIVLMYPVTANFKIVLKPSRTANASSVRTIFFTRADQNTTHQPQAQSQNVGLGSVEGLGAFERMLDTQNALNDKKIEQERKVLVEEFSLRLEKDRIKAEKEAIKEERRSLENDKKNILAKKLGEGLGAFALNYAKNNPQLGAIISQLETPAQGLGATDDEDDEPEYDPKNSILEDLEEGIISLEDLQAIIDKKKYAYQGQETQETDEY